jgi:cyclophilin family peptidyl-prolyl cis-trans isomerase/HEAT repeat protein
MRLEWRATAVCAVALWLAIVALAGAQELPTLRHRMLAAEDARVPSDAAIAPLLEGLRGSDESLAVRAARGLGRFERPAFSRRLLPLLSDGRAAVRREAALALGQSMASVSRSEGNPPPELATVTRALHARLTIERDASVAVAIADTLGRLPHRTAAAVREAEQAIRPWLTQPAAFRGLEALIRHNQKLHPPEKATIDALRAAATLAGDSADAVVIRRVAWLAVNLTGAVDMPLIRRGAADADTQVRRHVAAALGAVKAPATDIRDLLLRALKDPSFNVRVEAVRVWARTHQASDCGPLIATTEDTNPHVAMAAIDVLGNGCAAGPSPRARLAVLADALPAGANGRWQPAARALVALAKAAPEDALKRVPRFAEHSLSFVRAYAARAAAILNHAPTLERLAADVHDNVRYEAVIALRALRSHAADGVFIEALSRRDYQLVLAAAQALEGTTARAAAVPTLLHAFNRITAERRDTSRDTRVALLVRLRELGGPEHAAALQPCLTDTDPVVAAECSATLQQWTGVRRTPKPTVAFRAPVVEPPPGRARVTMRGGRTFDLDLLGDEAPASVHRFTTLARNGYYNGLTFHRVLPNFVIQGGSPGANEYAGDGPFMRDEITARTHARGTVGVSTRGRDTGDAQFFVNLLDNPRLDRDFTIFALVVSGMEVVDAVMEGDVIERVEILPAPAAR